MPASQSDDVDQTSVHVNDVRSECFALMLHIACSQTYYGRTNTFCHHSIVVPQCICSCIQSFIKIRNENTQLNDNTENSRAYCICADYISSLVCNYVKTETQYQAERCSTVYRQHNTHTTFSFSGISEVLKKVEGSRSWRPAIFVTRIGGRMCTRILLATNQGTFPWIWHFVFANIQMIQEQWQTTYQLCDLI